MTLDPQETKIVDIIDRVGLGGDEDQPK